MIRTLKVRIKDKHAKRLCQMALSVNSVWNYINDYSKFKWKTSRKFINYTGLGGYADMTQGVTKDLGLHAGTIQKVCRQFDKAKRLRRKTWLRYRGFRSLGWIPFTGKHLKLQNGSFQFMQTTWKVWDSYGLSQYQAKDGCLAQDSHGHWYLCVPVETPDALLPKSNSAVGVDLGLKDSAVTSDGQKLHAKWYHGIQTKLAIAQRAKNKKRVRALHAKAKHQRMDALHKFSTSLIRVYGSIFVGDVSTEFLLRFNPKSTLDAGHGILKTQLRYKSQQAGRSYTEISEKFTTQTCSECGSIAGPRGRAGLNERSWVCSECGVSHDRDINAARNILALGLGHEPPVGENDT